ncbi:hypothetical protein TL16_g12660 [Triparma laevis f. inornata]|uniref:RRM domain-containing protein n=1 Tax=Triparma laevis f. inornata TaxID=1714386 RepID=A0A9W7BMV1_9STRA|nr:hypothetical protein TL16_g12660 [Triparma laevis f. inornata]
MSPTSPPPPAPGNTLFIEGLPYTLPPSTLTKFFKDAGFTLLEQRLPTWQDNPNRLRGFGHVVFESEDQAKKAIKELNGKQLPGHSRYITLKTANLPKAETQRPVRSQPEGCTSIHIRNLPYTITEDDVEKVFSEFGKITPNGIRLPLNLQNQPKGFGYVTYLSSSSALAAANKASKPYGVVVNGRPVFVDFDEKGLTGVKDSFRTKEGKVWNREMKNERREFGKEGKDGGGKEGKEKKAKT